MPSSLHRRLSWLPLLPSLLCGFVLLSQFAAPSPALAAEPALFPIRQGERQGLIDAGGKVLLAPEYDEVRVGDPLVLVRRGARTAYADAAGRLVVPP